MEVRSNWLVYKKERHRHNEKEVDLFSVLGPVWKETKDTGTQSGKIKTYFNLLVSL